MHREFSVTIRKGEDFAVATIQGQDAHEGRRLVNEYLASPEFDYLTDGRYRIVPVGHDETGRAIFRDDLAAGGIYVGPEGWARLLAHG